MFLRCLVLLLLSSHQAAADVAAAAEAASTAEDGLPGRPVPEADEMIEWIVENGGQVNVVVRELPGLGRFTLAAKDIKAGELLAAIPDKLCFTVPLSDNSDSAGAALLLAELRAKRSRYRPYLKTLPGRGEVRSYSSFPAAYFPLLQNEGMVEAVQEVAEELSSFWRQHADTIRQAAGDDVTFADMQFTADLLQTRLFDFDDLGEKLIPLVDLANHHNGCPHTVSRPAGCPSKRAARSDKCVTWRAEADVAAGAEVCNAYHDYMLQDRSLLHYGFLQRGEVAQELSGLDMRGFNPQDVWDIQQLPGKPPVFTGRPKELKAERARLRKLHRNITTADPELQAGISADSALDADGSFLAVLWEWRRQRLAAIAAEISRLSEVLGDSGAAAAGGGSGGGTAKQQQPEAAAAAAATAGAAGQPGGGDGDDGRGAAAEDGDDRGSCQSSCVIASAKTEAPRHEIQASRHHFTPVTTGQLVVPAKGSSKEV